MASADVVVLVGSLRKESLNRKVANALIALNAAPLKFGFAEFGHLPLYNQDLDGDNPPAPWVSFRQQIKSADAALFVTPEYNRSVPGALKNALDVGSRPYGKNVWNDKPGAVVSASPGAIGGIGAHHHLFPTLLFLNEPTTAIPQAYLDRAEQILARN